MGKTAMTYVLIGYYICSLYVEKINVGESEPREVVSGLRKHIPLEEFKVR